MKKNPKVSYAITIPFFLSFLALAAPSCTTPYYFDLSSSELARLKLEAVRGDGWASSRILNYYHFTEEDHNNELTWTLIGAENCDTYSMENLYMFYLGGFENEHENYIRAIFWIYQLAIYDYEDPNVYWNSEMFIEHLECEGYTLETACPQVTDYFPLGNCLPQAILPVIKKAPCRGAGRRRLFWQITLAQPETQKQQSTGTG